MPKAAAIGPSASGGADDGRDHGPDSRRQYLRGQRFAWRHRGFTTDPTGLFSYDTRFLSTWVLTVTASASTPSPPTTSSTSRPASSSCPATGTVYIDAKLSVIRERAVGDGFHEELTILNHGDEPVDLTVRIEAAQRLRRPVRGQGRAGEAGHVRHADRGRPARPRLRARDVQARDRRSPRPCRPRVDEHGLTFAIQIEPHGQWTTDLDVVTSPCGAGGTARRAEVRTRPNARRVRTWRRPRRLDRGCATPRVRLGAAEGDLSAEPRRPRRAALLAADRRRPSLPAAGLPWFMTMFGRDSIFTSLQALPFVPELAATTLRVLGDWQGSRHRRLPRRGPWPDPPRDALRRDGRVRGAAPLALLRRRSTRRRCMCPARRVRALDRRPEARPRARVRGAGRAELDRRVRRPAWATATSRTSGATSRPASRTRAGRTPGTRSPTADGRLPDFPRATCELQGYAYDAKVRGARLARLVWKDPAFADRLETEAADLKRRFNRDFWIPDREYYALALDADGTPGRLARLEHRPPAVERHRRRHEGQGRRAPPHGPAAVLRLGRPHACRGRGALQPDRLPPRDGLAVRQLVHRLGPAALRVQGGGGPDRLGHPRRRGDLRGPAARGVRRLRPRR